MIRCDGAMAAGVQLSLFFLATEPSTPALHNAAKGKFECTGFVRGQSSCSNLNLVRHTNACRPEGLHSQHLLSGTCRHRT